MIIIPNVILVLVKAIPRSPIKMWPVLKLAVSRTAKVIGRTVFLTSSITHKNGFNKDGEPGG